MAMTQQDGKIVVSEQKKAKDFATMDEAALAAQVEFEAMDEGVQATILEWGKKWFMAAGYKKLGKIISERLE